MPLPLGRQSHRDLLCLAEITLVAAELRDRVDRDQCQGPPVVHLERRILDQDLVAQIDEGVENDDRDKGRVKPAILSRSSVAWAFSSFRRVEAGLDELIHEDHPKVL